MVNKIKQLFKKNTEILALGLLVLITIISTTYYNQSKKKIYSNYEEYRKELKHHLHLLVTKYVYKWVESIQRNAVDIVIRRPELLDISYCSSQEKLKTENNMQVPISWVVGEINLIELVKLWNEFYSNWLELGPKFKHWGIVKYESLLIRDLRQNFLQAKDLQFIGP